MRLGFHASHEQIAPSRLLSDVQHAERAGFEMAMCSDHFAPWGTRQGHSGYAWSWLGAALATTGLEFGCVSRTGAALPPRRRGPEDRHAGRDVPRTLLDGPRQRRGEQRAHHRRPLATEGGPHAPAGGVRRRDPAPPGRRGGHPRRPRHRRPGPAVGPAGPGARGSSPPRCRWRARPAWSRMGRRARHGQPAGRRAARRSSRPTATPVARGRCALQVHLSWAPTRDEAEAVAHDQWRTNVFRPSRSPGTPRPRRRST